MNQVKFLITLFLALLSADLFIEEADAGILYGQQTYDYNLRTNRGRQRTNFRRPRVRTSTSTARAYAVPGIRRGRGAHLRARYYANKQSRIEASLEDAQYKKELLKYKKDLAAYKRKQLLKKKKLAQLKRKKAQQRKRLLKEQRRRQVLARNTAAGKRTAAVKGQKPKKRNTFWSKLKALFSDK